MSTPWGSVSVETFEGYLNNPETFPKRGYLFKSYDGDSETPLGVPQSVLSAIDKAQESVEPTGNHEEAGKLKWDGKVLGEDYA